MSSTTPSPSTASGGGGTIRKSTGDGGRGGRTPNSRAAGLRDRGGGKPRDHDRRGGGRGAGQGRTAGRGQYATGQHSVNPTPRPIRVVTSHFDSFRRSCQNAVKYKVHRPNCSCPNVKTLLHSDNNRRIIHIVGSANDSNKNHNNNNNNNEEEEWLAEQVSDGLLVLPDVRSASSVYFCLDTTAQIYDADPTQTELKLQSELFPPNHHRVVQPSHFKNNNTFKVSCAACLLEDIPNGFACILSTDQDDVDKVRDQARQLADENSTKHSDHAHFVATLPLDALMKLDQTKTRSQIQSAQDEIVQLLINQGVPIEPETHEIKLQHHLSALLGLFKDRHRQPIKDPKNNRNDGTQDSSWYCLVLGFDDTKGTPRPHWSLDLPGGKRHLGENTLQAAIRETQEETSFVWDADWIRDEWRGKGRSDFVNLYYILSPPRVDDA